MEGNFRKLLRLVFSKPKVSPIWANEENQEPFLRSRSPNPNELALGWASGKDETDGREVYQLKGIPQDRRDAHFYVVGATRSGKTKFLESLIKQDIEKLPRLFESMQLTKEYKEKGVDVKLAIDLVEFSINNKLDIAIVLSGDADLVPAVALARKFKKRVINAHLFTGSAAELRNASDSHFTIGKETLKDCWRKQEGMQS